MVYCVAFDCNVNSSKNKITCSWFNSLWSKLDLKKQIQVDKAQPALLALGNFFSIRTREGASLGYPDAKISLKEDDVPTLFPVVEVLLMPPICITQTATWASTTVVHLGSNRVVSTDIQVMMAHGEFGLVNSDSIVWRIRPATLLTSCLRAQWT